MAADTPANGAQAKGPQTQKVSDVISAFRPTKRFRPDDPKASITSLDFDDTGELAIVARDDDTLQMYNCKEGKHAKELKSQKYGVHLARFSHHGQSIIYASTKVDHTIRYLFTHDNSYIRYFRGHQAPVTCITLSPSSDEFLSCSEDNTVRLWNLNSNSYQGQLNIHSPHLAAYDPSATVIAIASQTTHSILLYDLRNYDKPPFATFDVRDLEQRYTPGVNNCEPNSGWTRLEFSNDGKSLLLGTNGGGHYLLDAFDGELKHFLARTTKPTASSTTGQPNWSGRRAPGEGIAKDAPGGPLGQGDVSISPDGAYVIGGPGGDAEGLVVWDLNAQSGSDKVLRPSWELPGQGKASIVGYNPKMNLICSADRDLLLWTPDQDLLP